MVRTVRTAARWVGRHAFPVIAAGVVAIGAAGGGIGYAVASGHSTAAPMSSTTGPAATTTPAAGTRTGTGKAASRGDQVVQRALGLLATQTGQSVAAVRSQLQAGRSIDDIAGATAPALESEILAQVNKLAARAVSAGRINAAQEAAALATAKTKVAALMAEPGTQLLTDVQKLLQFLQSAGARHHAGASPSPAA